MSEARQRVPVDDPDEEGLGGRMGFLAHLDEFRSRLIRCCVAIVVGMLVAVAFVGRIADFVLAPTMRVLPPGTNLIMTRPGEGLSFYLDLALIAGVLIATPYISFQVWRFIAPGLYAREKRMALPFIGLAIFGTVGGALFSHYALFPSMMAFFGTFDSPRMRFTPRLEDTFELYKNMLLAMVGVFQIPTLVFFLARMGLVTARFLWRHISYAVLISFIVAAALTPTPDPWNQTAFALPMVGLYIISIGVAWLVAPKRRPDTTRGGMRRGLKLVFAAAVVDQVARRRHRTPGTFPRKV